jgi:hypothetical protein
MILFKSLIDAILHIPDAVLLALRILKAGCRKDNENHQLPPSGNGISCD